MTDNPDNFYTFSSSELAEIKADYYQLLADKHAHNRQFKKRNQRFNRVLVFVVVAILIGGFVSWVPIRLLWEGLGFMAQGFDMSPTYAILGQHPGSVILALAVPVLTLMLILLFWMTIRYKHLDQHLLQRFPTQSSRFYANYEDYVKQDQLPKNFSLTSGQWRWITQVIKLPDYLLVFPANHRQVPALDSKLSCWIIRRSNNPDLYQQLSERYHAEDLKYPRTRRWADYFLVDGTKKEN
ncbi:hypothetical protein [Oenococcus sicerae]|uniref:Uncharacterized protein n=1 Tax=Oenococcus sicerae TaxID=2203724 RepID=A0AAJ1RC56_9LACO|nr:hypothetical protein [Oenococcus sicerae]MDN6901070.1 hypothetical protein [Oenococcus sicerae]